MGRGGGGGGRSSGGGASDSGSGGGSVDQDPLGDSVRTQSFKGNSLNDTGNMMVFSANGVVNLDSISTNAQADPSMVQAFRNGQINTNFALVVETGRDSYRAIDRKSARLIESAKAAGVEANVRIIPNNATQIRMARQQQVERINFARRGSTRGLTDVGNMMLIHPAEISGGRTRFNQARIDSAARAVRANGGNLWQSIGVSQTGRDQYRVSDRDAFLLAVARRANVRATVYIANEQ